MQSAAELEQMLKETGGVPVSFGDASTWGHHDRAGVRAFDEASVLGMEASVLVPTGLLPGLAMDVQITVDGAAHYVRDHELEPPDGALTRVWLRES